MNHSARKSFSKLSRLFGSPEERFPLVVKGMIRQTDLGLHEHDVSELVIIQGGRGIHFTEEESYPVAAGDVFVIHRSLGHGYRDTEDLQLVNILYLLDGLRLPTDELRILPGYHALFSLEPSYRRRHHFKSRLRLDLEDLARVDDLAERLETELGRREPGFEFMARAFFMQVVGFLSRCYSRMRTDSARPLLRLGEALSHLERNYRDPIRLDELCRIAHMSESSLLRAFRRATGHSPIAYLIRLRILRACDLLRLGETDVTEAAFQVGFTDSNYFTRQFRKVMGESPGRFRKRHVN
jgi:AraC-like DNA-binding protein/quercetin dioxygenase-like cupin family protein